MQEIFKRIPVIVGRMISHIKDQSTVRKVNIGWRRWHIPQEKCLIYFVHKREHSAAGNRLDQGSILQVAYFFKLSYQ